MSIDDDTNTQQAIKDDFTNLVFATPRAVQDVTGIDQSAYQRLELLADFTSTLTGVFDPDANMAHAVFSTISSTTVSRLMTMVVNGKTLAPTVWFTDYSITRATSGALTFTAPAVLANGAAPTWS